MKFIFRYALLTHFTAQNNSLTIDQLKQALKSVKFQFEKRDLNNLIELNKNCIAMLLKNSAEDDVENLLREFYQQENVANVEYGELNNIWELEKHLIFKNIIAKSISTALIFSNLEWSVRNNVSEKHGQHNEENSSVLKFNVKTETGNGNAIMFSVNKMELNEMRGKLKSAESMLNQLFKDAE